MTPNLTPPPSTRERTQRAGAEGFAQVLSNIAATLGPSVLKPYGAERVYRHGRWVSLRRV